MTIIHDRTCVWCEPGARRSCLPRPSRKAEMMKGTTAEGAVGALGGELEECRARVAALEAELILTARLDRDRLEPMTRLNRRLREEVAALRGELLARGISLS